MSEMIRSLREVERTENVCEDMLSVDEFWKAYIKNYLPNGLTIFL